MQPLRMIPGLELSRQNSLLVVVEGCLITFLRSCYFRSTWIVKIIAHGPIC